MNILKRPMLYAAITCSLASVLSLYYINFSFLIIATVLALSVVVFRFRKFEYITVIAVIILFSVSLSLESNKIKQINNLDNKNAAGEFLVASEPVVYERFNQITLKVIKSESLPKGTKYLVFDDDKAAFSSGDIIKADLKISIIDKSDEYRFYDYGNGIYATANVNHFEKTDKSNKLFKMFNSIRTYIKSALTNFFDNDTAGFLSAITLGDKTMLTDSFLTNVKATGISHIIVVSGMHLSIIMSAIFLIIDRLFYNKYVRTILSLTAVLLITGVCGYTMSIIRAGVMFLISGFAPVFNREKDFLSSLLTAITFILIVTPFAIVNLSFLLSVLSTVAIIWITPFYLNVVVKKYTITSKILISLLNIIFSSIFAMIFTLPVIISTFGYSSVVAPITNVLVTYPVTVSLILSCLGLVLSTIPFISCLGSLLMHIAGLFSKLIIFIVNSIAQMPITVAIMPQGAVIVSVILIFIIIVYMYIYEYRSKKKEVIKCR